MAVLCEFPAEGTLGTSFDNTFLTNHTDRDI